MRFHISITYLYVRVHSFWLKNIFICRCFRSDCAFCQRERFFRVNFFESHCCVCRCNRRQWRFCPVHCLRVPNYEYLINPYIFHNIMFMNCTCCWFLYTMIANGRDVFHSLRLCWSIIPNSMTTYFFGCDSLKLCSICLMYVYIKHYVSRTNQLQLWSQTNKILEYECTEC